MWPENEPSFLMFLRSITQWRMSAGGVIGLDYIAVFELFKLYDIKKRDRRQMFEDIKAMEMTAVSIFNKKDK